MNIPKIDRSNFKDSMHRFRTQALFYEHPDAEDGKYAVFTMSDQDRTIDGKTYYSLKKLFLECGDPTEYNFAIAVFGSWPHWKRLCKYWLKHYIKDWREELELKLRADAIRNAIKSSANGNYNASKWLTERGWEEKRGRPSKDEVARRVEQDKRLISDVQEDMERLGISVIK